MKKIIYILFVVFICKTGFAQEKDFNNIDSMQNVLDTAKGLHKIDVLVKFASYYYHISAEKTIMYARKAVELSEKEKYNRGYVYGYYEMGNAYDFKGDYKKAIECYLKALENKYTTNDSILKGKLYLSIGNAHYYTGNYQKTLDNYIKATVIFQDNNYSYGLANAFLGQGNVYFIMNLFDRAIEYYSKALDIYKELDNKTLISYALQNIGATYYSKKDYDLAINYYIKSLELKKEMNDQFGMAYTLNSLGIIYKEQGAYTIAKDYIYKALKIREKNNETQGLISTKIILTELDILTGNYYEAKSLIDSIEINIKTHELNIKIEDFLKVKYEYYFALNQFDQAYNTLIDLNSFKDSILNAEKKQRLSELSIKYETESQKKKIQILNHDNSIQQLEINKTKQTNIILLIIIIGLIIGIMIVIVFSLMIVRSTKERRKRKLILEEQKNKILLQKEEIYSQKDEIESQRDMALEQKEQIEFQKKEITDSIEYAKIIQECLLPAENIFHQNFNDHFVLFMPKDIVSGDFYWAVGTKSHVVFAVADCTGHGVPGALLSMLGIAMLNDIVLNENTFNPSLILDKLRKRIIKNLKQDKSREEIGLIKDGMDIHLCVYDVENKSLSSAGAHNSLYLIKNGNLIEYKADRMPVGIHYKMENQFTVHKIDVLENDQIYIFTDGFVDQFGGEKQKKFGYRKFRETFLSISQMPMNQQKEILLKQFNNWKGDLRQIDDICIIGLKI